MNENNLEIGYETQLRSERIGSSHGALGSKITSLIMRYFGGIVKTEEQAGYLLFALSILVVIMSMVISVMLMHSQDSKINMNHPVYQEDLTPDLRKTLSPEVLESIPYRNEK